MPYQLGIFDLNGPLLDDLAITSDSIPRGSLHAAWTEYYERQYARARLAKGAFEMLRLLSECSIPMAVVSGAPKESITHLKRLGIDAFFERKIFGAPDKEEIIRSILTRYGIDARDAFYVDDSAMGIEQANRTGVSTFGFAGARNSLAELQAVNPKHIVGSFMEVTSIVRANIG